MKQSNTGWAFFEQESRELQQRLSYIINRNELSSICIEPVSTGTALIKQFY